MTNFYCLMNGTEEFNSDDLISFNKVAIYGDNEVHKIKITDGDLIIEADYDTGTLLVNRELIKLVDNPSILRPICIRRNTVDLNPFRLRGRKYGLGWQYTIDGVNYKDIVLFFNNEYVLVNE